jgi:hypothetical protein
MRILICLLFSIVAVDFATAGCKINLRVKNKTGEKIIIGRPLSKKGSGKSSGQFHAKSWGAPYVQVSKRGWLAEDWEGSYYVPDRSIGMPNAWIMEPEETAFDTYKAVLGCNINRNYRLAFRCIKEDGYFTPRKWRYFPRPGGYTKSQNVTIPIKSCK